MIIEKDSPFRRLRADLAPQQASFLDGIRISAEMTDVAYNRLSDSLWKVSNENQLIIPAACLFLDAWAIIDSVHRLRDLMEQMPGLKKNGPKYQLFQRATQSVSDFRNIVQHLRGELNEMANHGWPVWGSIAWIAVLDPESRLVSSCAIIPGRIQSVELDILNPADRTIVRRIDHITLSCKSDQISLTQLFEEVGKIVRFLEPCLNEFTADLPTLPSDFYCYVKCTIDQESAPSQDDNTPVSIKSA